MFKVDFNSDIYLYCVLSTELNDFSGTYPGAVINVKNGSGKNTVVSAPTPVKPIKPALSSPALGTNVEKLLIPVCIAIKLE